MPGQVPAQVIEERHGRLLELVNEIGKEKYRRWVGRRSRERNQAPAWSRSGPEIEVNEATRPASAPPVTACQAWMEPQSWASRWTSRRHP